MGFLSDAWDSVKDTVSDAWDGAKDAVKDVTGVDSMNDFLIPGAGVASAIGTLQGNGIIGQALGGMMGQQQPMPGGSAMTGPLTQGVPSNLTMGTGGGGGQPSGGGGGGGQSADLFGPDGYSYGNSPSTSAQLLQPNPEAYAYQPLFNPTA